MSETQATAGVVDSAAVVVPVRSVLVADRYRKDLGDVSELAASIVEIGLLNPITVAEYYGGYRLVAGERRLRAFEALELTEIPARVARNIVEARDLLVAERDENTQRKPMLPSEATALGMAIEEMEKPAARERQGTRTDIGHSAQEGGKFQESREIAAEAVGLSRGTYARIKEALVTAEDEDEDEDVRQVARDVVEQIDAGEPVAPQVARIRATRSVTAEVIPFRRNGTSEENAAKWAHIRELADQGRTSDQIAAEIGMTEESVRAGARRLDIDIRADRVIGKRRRINPLDVLEKTVLGLEVNATSLALVDYEDVTPEQAYEWLERLAEPLRVIRKMQTQLKEISNDR